MSRNISCTADAFAVAFDEMLRDIEKGLDGSLVPAVRKGCKVARDETRTWAAAMWPESDYPVHFSYQTEKDGLYCEGEVGNETKPGLVHLLEKGHAKIGGGRTRAFVHVEDGYKAGAEAFEQELSEGVRRAL